MSALALLSSIVLAMSPTARQVVQAGPTGPLAVSSDGYAAIVDGADTLHIYHLASRTLVRSIAAATLNGQPGMVHPVIPTWDDVTREVLVVRGNDILGVGIDGKLTERTAAATRIWPVGGGGATRWIVRQYGDAEAHDAAFRSRGSLVKSEAIAAAGNGKSVVLATKDGLVRFALDPVGKPTTIPLPAPADQRLTGHPVAVSYDGTTAAVCLKTPKDEYKVAVVRQLDKQPAVTTIDFAGLIGCEVAIAEAHDVLVVGGVGELRGFDLATGRLKWQAPREYGLHGAETSELAISGRTLVVSWQGLVLIDVVRGDVIDRIGTELVRPDRVWFLKGDQLLVARNQPASMFGPTGVDLSTWSLKDGRRTGVGAAKWGMQSQVSEDGALWTVRLHSASNENCYAFSRGTTADGAPDKDVVRGWPPAPGKSKASCAPKSAFIAGASFATGALITNDKGLTSVIPNAGAPVVLQDAPKAAMDMTFSPDGKWVMGTNLWGGWASLQVWDVKTGNRRWFTGSAADTEGIQIGAATPRKGYNAHAITADSEKIVVAGGDTMTLYALATKRAESTASVQQTWISAVAFAPGNTVIGGTANGQLLVWRGAKLDRAPSDGGAIQQIAVRADGKRAATLSDDHAIRIWDLAKPALLATLVETTDGEAFASTPGGAYAGGREAAEHLAWVFDAPAEGFRFERFAKALARPDVVAKRLVDATTDLNLVIARPPRVTVTKQPPPSGNKLEITAKVEASAGKVTALRAFVNGRASATKDVNAQTADVTLDITLEAGSNVVTLIAFDDAGRSSNPKSLDVATAPPTTRPDVWVIAAGVGWYPNLPVEDQLEGSVNDAYAIADAFDGQVGKRYEKSHITVLEDEKVTPDALDKALAQLAQMKPNDVAIVFLAGHGVRLPKTDDMVLLTGTAKLDKTTWATSGIGWTKIGAALQRAKGRVVVLLDACHAGNVTQDLIVPNTQLADDLVGSQRAGVLVFAASKGSQKSLEENAARAIVLDEDQKILVKHKRTPKKPTPPPPPPSQTAPRERRGNGFFTGAVVAALDSPVTDINRDGVVQTAELVTQVQLRVIRASRGKQTPWVARRELFGDFAVANAAK